MRAATIAMVFLLGGCNVFFGLNSIEPVNSSPDGGTTGLVDMNAIPPEQICEGDCVCEDACTVDCSGCGVECERNAECSGSVRQDANVQCDSNAQCDLSCTSGSCTFECTDRDSDCFIDCNDAADCLLDCGSRRNGQREDDCVFVNCDTPTECDSDVFVCNRPCP